MENEPVSGKKSDRGRGQFNIDEARIRAGINVRFLQEAIRNRWLEATESRKGGKWHWVIRAENLQSWIEAEMPWKGLNPKFAYMGRRLMKRGKTLGAGTKADAVDEEPPAASPDKKCLPPGRTFNSDEAAKYLSLTKEEFQRQVDEGCLEVWEGQIFHIADLQRFVRKHGGQFHFPISAADGDGIRFHVGWEIHGRCNYHLTPDDVDEWYEETVDYDHPKVVWPS